MSYPEPLLRAALDLRGAAPAAWETFLAQVQAHADQTLRRVLTASPDQLAAAQGQARSLAHLATGLTGARELLDAISKKSTPR